MRQTKRDTKGFFQLYRTKARINIGLLRSLNSRPPSYKDNSTPFNEYFFSIFTNEDTSSLPQADQVFFKGRDEEM